jgi:phosphoglucomutase
MYMNINPSAGKLLDPSMLVDLPRLITSYYTDLPDASVAGQGIMFGTSGHRGSAFDKSFNEPHIIAITEAICQYRKLQKIDGPLFLGMDTHALSVPAFASALEVLAANNMDVMIAGHDEYTPTPVISHAILHYNRGRKSGLADGIVITPSHNPPHDGGFKYNPPNGGPSSTEVSDWIQDKANEYLAAGLKNIKRVPYEKALKASTTHRYDYINTYINELNSIINMDAIRDSKIHIGADPMGGAGVHYWAPIADKYGLNMTIVNKLVDPTFRFMPLDWDGQIRMDPSSSYAMQHLIGMKDQFDIAFACDTDHDRHGIVSRSSGLLPPNHYLSVAVHYLLQYRKEWNKTAAIGKTVVTSRMIDRVAIKLGRKICDVPVGFKWFSAGLLDGSLCFGGEESAGAIFSRINGDVWTTDKDGIVPALLSAEILAVTGQDPGDIYMELINEFGESFYDRKEAAASPEQQAKLGKLSAGQIKSKNLAGEKILNILTVAPGNNEAIGGIKIETENGWFAARPSGTEKIYKIYAESFKNERHLEKILEEAQAIVNETLLTAGG